MMQRFVYIVSTEARSSTDGCIEHVWSYSIYYAKMYAAAFTTKQSKRYQYEADISQYDTLNKDDMDIISTRCTGKNMIRVTTNLVGEQFLLTETAENNAYNIGVLKMLGNKYLKAFNMYFDTNSAGALFATVHSVNTLLKPILKNKAFKKCLVNLIEWMLDKNGVELDYFTFCTLVNDRIRKYKIGTSAGTEKGEHDVICSQK